MVTCGIRESPIDCQKRADLAAAEEKAYQEAVKKKGEMNRELAAARAQFWATYPDKPGAEAARQKFADLLHEKDIYYLILNQYPQNAALTQQHGQGAVASLFDLYVGGVKLDNGIPRTAQPEFFDWAEAFRKNLAASGGLFTMQASTNAFKALAASQKEFDIYKRERDWAEFDAVGRVPVAFEAPRNYAAMLYFRFGQLGLDAALEEVASMAKVLGGEVVDSAAQQVKAAPKAKNGALVVTVAEPVRTGPGGTQMKDDSIPAPPNVIGSMPRPLSALEALATRGDDRRYLLNLIGDNSALLPNQSRFAGKWERAAKGYDRLAAAFGDTELLAAAHQVRMATKRLTDGYVMDPAALGSTRQAPYAAFEDVLARKDPRGYVRSVLAFARNVSSKAEVDAAYRDFLTGKDENKVIETARAMAAQRPELAGDFETLNSALNGTSTVTPATRPTVDDWQYASWKGFAAGAKASYVLHGLVADRRDPSKTVAGPATTRSTFTLQSIDGERARLWLTEDAYDYPSTRALPPHDTEVYYGARRPAPIFNARLGTPAITTGEETLDIQGRKIATRWQAVQLSRATCSIVNKIWLSDEVPGGVVRKLEQNGCFPGGGKTTEEILESFQGAREPGNRDIFEQHADASAETTAAPANTGGRRRAGAVPAAPPPPPEPASDFIDPAYPHYYLTDKAAAGLVSDYCRGLYNPAGSLLPNARVKFVYDNRAAVDADVKTCISWFDIQQARTQRKQAMRYCLTTYDFVPPLQRARRAGYDTCMNQHDTITALCTLEGRVRVELMQAGGVRTGTLTCPGPDVAGYGEEAVAVRGGSEDRGRPIVATPPGLPARLQAALPKGLVRGGVALSAAQ